MEFVSPEGLRLDGRRPKELRRLACELGCLSHTDGSAMLQMGNTQVICEVILSQLVLLWRDPTACTTLCQARVQK